MIKACDLKNGSIVDLGGVPHVVESIQVHSPTARGGTTLYKVRFRNVQTKQKVDQSLKGEEALQEAHYETREAQYLYKNGDVFTFMDLDDYSQFDLNESDLKEIIPYLIDDMEGISAIVSDGRILAVKLPDVVELEIAECGPSMKGASATARTKPATLSTGLIVQVPEYLAPGEVIRVDTRNGTFLGRA
ncbi:MAG: elongation factor P [Verrucomicrobia bacterium]|nr:elongation factor P [Verrucomicrobiota bacterium]